MEMFLSLLVVGTTHGCIYGIIGLAFLIIFNGTSIINVAQGEFVMLGAVLACYTATKLHFSIPVVWLISIVIVIVLALVFHLVFTRPLLKKGVDLLSMVIITLAGSMLITGTTGLLTAYSSFWISPILPLRAWKLGVFSISPLYTLIIGATILIFVLYWFFERKTIIGLAFRATGLNRNMAELLGISTSKIAFLAFSISGFISGLTGFLYAPITNVSALIGAELLLNGFVAAVIGGMENPYAALVGGILLGVVASLAAGYVAPGFAALVTFFMLIIILIFRPHGLIGVRHG